MKYEIKYVELKTLIAILFAVTLIESASAQGEHKQMVRMARLVIDSVQLNAYNALLKEEIETSVKVEPGVLMLYAVSEKLRPTHITIVEIYADEVAYKKHIEASHFLKYKNGTRDMVKSLELVEVDPLIKGIKFK